MTRFRLCLSVLLVAGCACSGRSHHAPAEPRAATVPGMDHAVRVGDLLFGAQPSREALKILETQGYKTVLSTRGETELTWDEGALADSLGMRFVSIPMPKPVTAITDQEVNRFADLMESGERPIVLHCGSGNRVAGLWAVWLVERRGMAPEEALDLAEKAGLRELRPVVEARLNEHRQN